MLYSIRWKRVFLRTGLGSLFAVFLTLVIQTIAALGLKTSAEIIVQFFVDWLHMLGSNGVNLTALVFAGGLLAMTISALSILHERELHQKGR